MPINCCWFHLTFIFRGVDKVKTDFDNSDNTLLAAHNYCSQGQFLWNTYRITAFHVEICQILLKSYHNSIICKYHKLKFNVLELVNLLLVGEAVSNVFNNNLQLSEGDNEMVLKVIKCNAWIKCPFTSEWFIYFRFNLYQSKYYIKHISLRQMLMFLWWP